MNAIMAAEQRPQCVKNNMNFDPLVI